MLKQIRCYGCGATIEIDPTTLMVVCPTCKDNIAVVQHEANVGAAETVPAFSATYEMGHTPQPNPLAHGPTAFHPAQLGEPNATAATVAQLGSAATVALPAQLDETNATAATVAPLRNAATVAQLGSAATVALPAQSDLPAVMPLRPTAPARPAPVAQTLVPTPAPRPTPQPRSRRAATATTRRPLWLVLVGVVLLGTGAGLAAYYATRSPAAPASVRATPPTAAVAPAPPSTATPGDLVTAERAAIARGEPAGIATLLAPAAFGHGTDAAHVAYTAPTTAAMIAGMLGGPSTVSSTWSRIEEHDDVAWIADELVLERAGKRRTILTSQLAVRVGDTWKIAAWHWGELVRNGRAYELAIANQLPPPAPVTDQVDDNQQIFEAFRNAFASLDAFVEAFSDRPDAIDLGSAPNERVIGGAQVKRIFGKLKATIRVHDGVAAGRVTPAVGWAAANVDFTITTKTAGEVTQTFRVLAVLRTEAGHWRIAFAQWSNAGPIP